MCYFFDISVISWRSVLLLEEVPTIRWKSQTCLRWL